MSPEIPNIMESLAFSFIIPSAVMWILFWLGAAIFATMSVVLFYHWRSFEFDKIKVRLISLIYFFGGLAVLLIIFSSIAIYSRSL